GPSACHWKTDQDAGWRIAAEIASVTIYAGQTIRVHRVFPVVQGKFDMPGCGPHPEGTRVTVGRGFIPRIHVPRRHALAVESPDRNAATY
ncbi:MAG TPA: hypothetical protein VKX16_18835, partial [Chloroflexota bacterium]|nr:hypothetical protein [Chloroflexota bacterium]